MLERPKGLNELLVEFEEKSHSNPTDLSLLFKLGRLYIRNGAVDDAIRVFQRVLAVEPKNFTGLLEIGLCYARLHQCDEARFHIEIASEQQPNSYLVYLAFAKFHELNGEVEQQVAALLRAAGLAPKKPEIRLQIAELMRRHGDFPGAARQYEMVLQENPFNETALFALSTILMKQNQLNEAMKHLRAILARNPSAFDAHLNLAQCLYRQEKYALAVPSFNMALRGMKENPQAQFLLAQCYFQLNDWDRALVIMEQLAETSADNVPIQLALGELYLKTDELDAAREIFTKLRRKMPERSELALKLANIQITLKRFSEASTTLNDLFVTHPGHIEGHRLLGDLYLQCGQLKQALEEYKRTLLVNESFVQGYIGVARVCRLTKEITQEYEALKKAFALQDSNMEVLLRLGELERELGMPASLERFKKVSQHSPGTNQSKEADYYLRHPGRISKF